MPVQPASAAERGRAERSSLPGRTAAPFREVAAAPSSPSRRGRLARRMLLCADVAGLTTAFVLAQFAFGRVVPGDRVQRLSEYLLFLATLPVWVVVAKLHGLYDRDLRRAEHTESAAFVLAPYQGGKAAVAPPGRRPRSHGRTDRSDRRSRA